MYLYNLTLSRASAIQCAIYGNFSAPKAQEIVVSRGKILELLRPNENRKVVSVCAVEVFGCVRSLLPFRLTGASRDYIMVGSDSGRVVILEFSADKNTFVKIHQETFGRSGVRRIVPGQFLAGDPKGRACMLVASEKQKFVYVLNRDNAANLTISSPLEAHKAKVIVFSVCGMDCGFDNPVFAAIELDYENADQDSTGEAASQAQKHLSYYELDLGLNHVLRKAVEPIDNGANLLIPVPGGADGPSGVLVCAENFIMYRNMESPEEVRAVIPRRSDLPADRGVLIVTYAMHKRKNMFFFLVQSEYGDIYKVTVDYEGETVRELKVKYFDTIPPCVSICVLKTGFLFAASEFGNHALYQFLGTGDDDDDVESSSLSLVETEEGYHPVFFEPRKLRNLMLVDGIDNLSPITDAKVANLLREEIPQIYTLCGRGTRSSMRVLRPGLAVTELAVAPLPSTPTAVFTIRRSASDEYDCYIIVSFQNATLVFSIGDEIKETNDSGFLGTSPTLHVQLLSDSSMLQVHPGGLRHIRPDRRINEWRVPGRSTITKAATNPSQVVIGLSGGEIVYFEMDPIGQLLETEKKDTTSEISCMDVAPIPEGKQRTRFVAIGSIDSTVRVMSLDPGECLNALALQAVPAIPESLLFLSTSGLAADGSDEGNGPLFLQLGLNNGVLLRTEVGRTTGTLSDTRTRFLGTRAPKLFRAKVKGRAAMLALTSRPWLGFSDMGRYNVVPLSYEVLDHASGFASDQCPEGFVAVSKSTLRIITVENVGETFNQSVAKLMYTPRKFVIHESYKVLVVVEADHQSVPHPEAQQQKASQNGTENGGGAGHEMDVDDEGMSPEEQFGASKSAPGEWASCVQVVDPKEMSVVHTVHIEGREAAISLCLAGFNNRMEEGSFLVVGTVNHMKFCPLEADGGFIRVYRFLENGQELELVHKTPVEGIPLALSAFKGKLLAGIGTSLRMYEMGKKKLLRKCEYRKLPNSIVTIHCKGNRIYLGTAQDSFMFMKYKPSDNQFYIFADDIANRYATCSLNLDYDTMCGADKFGNVYITRLPEELSGQVEDDPTGGKLAAMTSHLNGAPNRLENIIQFHIGEIVTSLQLTAMQAGGTEIVLYTTILGAIGVLLPFQSRQDVDFFQHLEMHMRQENPPLCGRDHLMFRSYYFPAKDTVDGDLCEQFSMLSTEKQRSISDELDRTPGEILKKLEKIRNKIL
ncbi:hypothetical protein BSKO_07499 [Bryopsis sp. KO-2023]|nr:hypothetical protein BSKO_07499 [Bryopsis sp. KO-2023]